MGLPTLAAVASSCKLSLIEVHVCGAFGAFLAELLINNIMTKNVTRGFAITSFGDFIHLLLGTN